MVLFHSRFHFVVYLSCSCISPSSEYVVTCSPVINSLCAARYLIRSEVESRSVLVPSAIRRSEVEKSTTTQLHAGFEKFLVSSRVFSPERAGRPGGPTGSTLEYLVLNSRISRTLTCNSANNSSDTPAQSLRRTYMIIS
ncbi:hypothetical protein L210DRAFT_317128 [Boletus edulis BED1]|uniref:Uncharacterized protein n=1 Tax=Boletus edulis BED1 TaxID=1328754 RepID=A0AAD4BAU2_BOLED|nr:hypothetical protein L210DRAFT_317128 [Boletus edulis BED1]